MVKIGGAKNVTLVEMGECIIFFEIAGKFIYFSEIGGICIIGLEGMDAPARFDTLTMSVHFKWQGNHAVCC